jgi:hypothetical protein
METLMRRLTEHFVRDLFGSWLCIEAIDLDLPGGRVHVALGTRLTRGTTFLGIDLVSVLDEQWDKERQSNALP